MQLLLAELLSAKSILADELERVRATFVSVDRLALRFKEELSKLKEHYHDLHNIDDKEIGEISSRLFQKVTVDSSYHVEVSMTCHVGKFFGCQ